MYDFDVNDSVSSLLLEEALCNQNTLLNSLEMHFSLIVVIGIYSFM